MHIALVRKCPYRRTSRSNTDDRSSWLGKLVTALFIAVALLSWGAIPAHTADLDEQIIEAAKTGDSTRVKNLLAEQLIDAAAYGDLAKVKLVFYTGAHIVGLCQYVTRPTVICGTRLSALPERAVMRPSGASR